MKNSVIPGSVVVGVDGSEDSDLAVTWAAAHADAQRRPLALVHGATVPVVTDFGFDLDEARKAARMVGRRVTDQALALVRRSHPDLVVTTHVEALDPRELLVTAGSRASVVVVGSRGRGAVASLLLGSVSV